MSFKIFGREPALVVAVIAAALSVVVSFGWPGLTAEQAGLWIVAVNAGLGVVTAILTRPIAPAAFTYFIGSAATLVAAYGFSVPQATLAAVNGLVVAVLVLLMRGQVSPQASPVSNA